LTKKTTKNKRHLRGITMCMRRHGLHRKDAAWRWPVIH
jgi:ribosomal protein L35